MKKHEARLVLLCKLGKKQISREAIKIYVNILKYAVPTHPICIKTDDRKRDTFLLLSHLFD